MTNGGIDMKYTIAILGLMALGLVAGVVEVIDLRRMPVSVTRSQWSPGHRVLEQAMMQTVEAHVRANSRGMLALLALVVLELGGGATLLFRQYRGKASAGEDARQSRNRQMLADAVRRSEERCHAMIDASHDVIWMLDAQGLFTFCNRRAEEFSGYTKAEVTGRSIWSLIEPHVRGEDARQGRTRAPGGGQQCAVV
jgi:PAS domain-containing protein